MNKSIIEELKRKISDFRELGLRKYFPRENRVAYSKYMVATIIGSRRSGKSFRTIQYANELLKSKEIKSLNHICRIDFDNPILSSIDKSELHHIEETFLELTNDANLKTPLLFIFDEIHKIDGWEEYLIDLSSNPNWQTVVTGSSSKMLKSDLSTELRGKSVSTEMYPLAFTEFLTFKNIKTNKMSTKNIAETKRAFTEYLHWGGFPAIAETDNFMKEKLLREYYDTMILKDIIARYNISKPQQAISLYNYFMSNIAKPYTIESSYKYLKQNDFTTSKDSIKKYIEWGEDSWLFFSVPIFSDSIKTRAKNYKKCYAIDWALANKNSPTWDGHHSRAFENLIYLHLRRKYCNVNYYLTKSTLGEVDFICTSIHGKIQVLVQASYNVDNDETLKREVKPLLASAKYFDINNCYIVTDSNEFILEEDGITINIVPAWKWLLSS